MRLLFAMLFMLQLDATLYDCKQIDEKVQQAMETFHIPGASIGLIVDGEVIHIKGYGTRDVRTKEEVTPNSCFAIASCSKAFTAYLLAELIEEGKASWDDPVTRFLPQFAFKNSPASASITLRDLVSHRTGMERYDTLWVAETVHSNDPVKLLNLLEPRYAVGERYEYNNYMYKIAGLVIEKITGNSWEKEVETRIFHKLSLKNSSCSISVLPHEDITSPHAEILGSIVPLQPFDPLPIAPGGGIVASISDLAAWTQFHLMTEKGHIKAMQTVQMPFSLKAPTEEIQPLGYGLGWYIGNYRGNHWVYHEGSIHGFHSSIAMLPEKKMGVIVLTNMGNNGNPFVTAMRNTLLDILLGEEKDDHLSAANQQRIKMQDAIDTSFRTFNALGEQKPDECALEEIQGSYTHPAYGELKISLDEGRLLGQLGKMSFSVHFKDKDTLIAFSDILMIYGVPPLSPIQINRDGANKITDLDFNLEAFRGTLPFKFKKQGLPLSSDQNKNP